MNLNSGSAENAAEAIFIRALELPSEERAQYLEEACGENEILRRRVEALLRAHDGAPQFLPETPATPRQFSHGYRINDYEIEREIARGGMGVVFRARQISLNRTVALKMILAGRWATPGLVQRFRTEAEAAARLDHPHIVPVYEIGEHEGQSYFSMKLIEGGTLADRIKTLRPTSAGNDKRTRPTQAARFLATVAAAIHYAHQRGVLHRDLKPTNILIDHQDQPHVTDFGLAKLTEVDSTDGRTSVVLGTPNYMAPEQAKSDCNGQTIAADIYSLGAILYEMITGRPPFQAGTPLETIRRVCEEDPAPPRSLNPELDRDMETICLKCLNKEPEARYASALLLAEDLNRWLAGQTILARPAGRVERTWRWVRRKPAIAGLSAAVILVLLTGAAVGLWQANRAGRAEFFLQGESEGNDKVVAFLRELLDGLTQSVAEGQDYTRTMELIEKAVARMDKQVPQRHRPEANLREVIGTVYSGLGDFPRAEIMFRQALETEIKLHGSNHLHVARYLIRLSHTLIEQGRLTDAEGLLQESSAIRRNGESDEENLFEEAKYSLAAVRLKQGKFPEAEKLFRQVLVTRQSRLGSDGEEVLETLNGLSVVLLSQGKPHDAIEIERRVVDARRKRPNRRLSNALNNLAAMLFTNGGDAEAMDLCRERLAFCRKELGEEDRDTIEAEIGYAAVLANSNREEEAEPLVRKILETQKRLKRDQEASTAAALYTMSQCLEHKGKLEEAEAMAERALELNKKFSDPRALSQSMSGLATVKKKRGQNSEAVDLQRAALEIDVKMYGERHFVVAGTKVGLAMLLRDGKKFQEADKLFEDALEIRKATFPGDHPQIANVLHEFSGSLFDQRRLSEAEPLAIQALEMRTRLLGPDDPKTIESTYDLGSLRAQQSRFPEAEILYKTVVAARQKTLGPEHPSVGATLYALCSAQWDGGRPNEAVETVRQALPIYQRLLRGGDTNAISVINGFAWGVFGRNGQIIEAQDLLNELLATVNEVHGSNSLAAAERLNNMGDWLKDHGPSYRSEKLYLAALELRHQQLGDDNLQMVDSLNSLGRLYYEQNKLEDSEKRFKHALAICEKRLGREHQTTVNFIYDLALPLHKQGKYAESESLLLDLYRMIQPSEVFGFDEKRKSIDRLRTLYIEWDASTPSAGKRGKAADWEKRLSEFDEIHRQVGNPNVSP